MSQSQWALVTGASSGIGFELAREFVEHGYDVIVAAEDDAIHAVPERLARNGTRIEAVQVDLGEPDGPATLYETATSGGRYLDAAALGAGIGSGGLFVETDIAQDLAVIDLNVRSTVLLAKLVVRDMAARGAGKVLFTSSVAATMPGPKQPVYNASKSFVQSFAEALRDELKDSGVTVTALMPGATDTNFFDRARMGDTVMGRMPKDDPAKVAAKGFQALMDDKQKVVASSLVSKLLFNTNRLLPDAVTAKGNKLMSSVLPKR
ncbi:SDR family NAD(P)-dependent oxidoreductase [Mycobacterium sp. MYCO198283]|uniref:SDR family NAD(P)-dependent oxidoreductase n=1 Tax=Mycobacterium sp. MYCO198283 TaxID=2883505 RepID=UPI001E3BDA46|nr:SDR family NAD(P)-dependent oxidoreductase [Mycobacterium sp. MYCO198283]MCG5431317.1 SDR family NAD(P)-dependent oxidoreductase [Mycobacterium sp. MYCO198283]